MTPTRAHHEAVDAAIELFTRQGYERTTVEEIADAANISRATFFRRYGSKEDVVFADHEVLLDDVVVLLAESRDARSTADPLVEVCRAARLVFDHHVSQPRISRARHALLQQVPALRDRELVTTHRYERAFTRYLRGRLPEGPHNDTASVAFAASVVAVHNAILRRWLRDPERDMRPALEDAFGDLRRAAARAAGPAAEDSVPASTAPGGTEREPVTPTGDIPAGRPRVVVAVVEAADDATADDVARAVRDALA
ncbi:TetR family transcriptional regulator [Sediminihabitans luteus]|uniref:TetR family transcriptional regulator n=1 Tax=Sediminihabitans luteus TaxID=1138585 RepID=A0A2M9CEH9_9CELL|nr:TetR/AcrR family transcriptional regulator [Sediminihabitans luteus]PJJ70356.1 TetR family transcriptional regulator [Sediminihabitans luteus]GII97828.1 hypothetical protein Slu03_02060 [Sediminihabitans luteus]